MLLVTFVNMISHPIVITAIILAALGIACSLLATKVTKSIRKTENISQDDKILIGMKIAGLTLILLGFIFLFFWGTGAV